MTTSLLKRYLNQFQRMGQTGKFSFWEESRRRIDLLAIDKAANIVVIELKRDETGAHMELQALRYASMMSTLTFNKATEYFQKYLDSQELGQDAKSILLDFVDLSEDDLDEFGRDVRIILASADFSKELTNVNLNQRATTRSGTLIPLRSVCLRHGRTLTRRACSWRRRTPST